MKIRCYDKNNRNYSKYGQKGIKVCDEWKNNFINFYEWFINKALIVSPEVYKNQKSKRR